jgi:hypothetical protein
LPLLIDYKIYKTKINALKFIKKHSALDYSLIFIFFEQKIDIKEEVAVKANMPNITSILSNQTATLVQSIVGVGGGGGGCASESAGLLYSMLQSEAVYIIN